MIEASWRVGVRRLLFLGSSCIYPKFAEQPIREETLLTGALEPTNAWYAIAKISGIKMCEALRLQHGFDAISLMPTNLYGPGDNYHQRESHVVPAMIRRFQKAKESAAKEYRRRRDKGKRDPNFKPEHWSFNIARPSVGREIWKRDKREFGEKKRVLSSRMGRYLKSAETHLDNVCKGIFP